MTSAATVVPDVVFIFLPILTHILEYVEWHVTTDLVNISFSIPIHIIHQKQGAFSWQSQQTPLTSYLSGILITQSLSQLSSHQS